MQGLGQGRGCVVSFLDNVLPWRLHGALEEQRAKTKRVSDLYREQKERGNRLLGQLTSAKIKLEEAREETKEALSSPSRADSDRNLRQWILVHQEAWRSLQVDIAKRMETLAEEEAPYRKAADETTDVGEVY